MKKVVIVNSGRDGALPESEEIYTLLCRTLKEVFEQVRVGNIRAFEVEIVNDLESAQPLDSVRVLVFVTDKMLEKAFEIQGNNPTMRVVVMATIWPEKKVMVVDKQWPVLDWIRSLA